ncbi:MAG TPA: alpha/beta hydrolase [Solirubrobacteraceae bacterium]|jgi:pimeloyl-ACP methyl ester carboxylesterase|nr:alpha/beta hydrolase [Solirubrobacteraceae bacterium]
MPDAGARPLEIRADGVTLSGEEAGEGPAIVLVHGLTASRRYVVHGSRTLERAGHRVIYYDARGHGRSTPPSGEGGYRYRWLCEDLAAVLDAAGVERVALAGVSMGAHTIVRFALAHPERVAALAIITPAYEPRIDRARGQAVLAGWDALARGLREGGVEGFVRAYGLERVPESMRATIETVLRQRMAQHEHPLAVADALEGVPRSRPFAELSELAAIAAPTIVIGSRDELDDRHPLRVAERYAQTIPGAALLVEDEGQSPLSWQGGRVSRAIAELAERAGWTGAASR